jgi:hypothetical protein
MITGSYFSCFYAETAMSVLFLLLDELFNAVNRHRRVNTDSRPKARVFARIGVLPSLAG